MVHTKKKGLEQGQLLSECTSKAQLEEHITHMTGMGNETDGCGV